MRKARILLILGIWVAALPYLGFTYSLKGILTTLSGLGFILVSYMLYREYKAQEIKEKKTFDNFSENSGFDEKQMETEETESEPQS